MRQRPDVAASLGSYPPPKGRPTAHHSVSLAYACCKKRFETIYNVRGASSTRIMVSRFAKTGVAIVGGGPSGLTLAALLGRRGVPAIVLEKGGNRFDGSTLEPSAQLPPHPKAHFINARTMEIFRHLHRTLETSLTQLCPPLDHWRHFRYGTSVLESNGGVDFGKVDHFREETCTVSPCCVQHISQPLVIQHLRKVAMDAQLSCHSPGSLSRPSPVQFHSQVVMVEPRSRNDVGVVLTTADGRKIEAEVAVAADGANSSLKKMAGIQWQGVDNIDSLISVHFRCLRLGHEIIRQKREAMLHFIYSPAVISVLVCHDLNAGEFVLQIPFFPPIQRIDEFTPAVCAAIVNATIGKPEFGIRPEQVISVMPWTMAAQVAERFWSDLCAGSTDIPRLFLLGDSAHRFPPAGGFGMNTGIQDAHNLAWRLSAVMKLGPQRKTSALRLGADAYQKERRAIAIDNTNLSLKNFAMSTQIPDILGLSRTTAHNISDSLRVIPSDSMRKAGLESVFRIGRLQCSQWFLEGTPIGRSRLSELRRWIQNGESLQLQFPRESLGIVYPCTNGSGIRTALHNLNSVHKWEYPASTSSLYQTPSGKWMQRLCLGGRFPHFWLRKGVHSDGEYPGDVDTVSSLDLFDASSDEHVLFISMERTATVTTTTSTLDVSLALSQTRALDGMLCPCKIVIFHRQRGLPNLVKPVHLSSATLNGKTHLDYEQYLDSETYGITDQYHFLSIQAVIARPDGHVQWMGCL